MSTDASALKVKKATPKAKKENTASPIELSELKTLPFFKSLDENIQMKILPKLQKISLARSENLFDGSPVQGEKSPVFMILKGDVSILQFTSEQKEYQQEGTTVNYLTQGEFYLEKLAFKEGITHIEIKAMCPIEALAFSYQELNYLFSKDKNFRDAFSEMIQSVIERQVSRFDHDFQKEIASFFVKERLTFSRRVKIKRMDICIECDGCYDACRDRHGTDRLGGSEVHFGITEIPQNCHNCVVPECIDKCKFGHITRHEVTNEIVISDNCVGCTQCSRGCSFGAIRMHPIETLDLAKYFPDRKPDAKGKNIAQKCDNCTDYEDRACITACPTGALFQVDGDELFNYWEQFTVYKNPGFEKVVTPEDQVNRLRPYFLYFTLLNLIFVFYETLSRLFIPEYALTQLAYEFGILATPLDPIKAFSPGNGFGHLLGYVGGLFMILTQTYTLGKQYAPKWGSLQQWMEIHIWSGFLGFIYGGAHSFGLLINLYHGHALKNTEIIAIFTFVLFLIAMTSGIVGRYLLYQLPRGRSEIELEIRQAKQEIENLFVDRRKAYQLISQLEKEQSASYAKEVASEKKEEGELSEDGQTRKWHVGGVVKQYWTDLKQYLKQNREDALKILARREQIINDVKENQVDFVLQRLIDKQKASRSVRKINQLSKILKFYRVIHVSIGHITFLALLLHILRSFHLI